MQSGIWTAGTLPNANNSQFNSVYVYDQSNAMVVGTNGTFLYTSNGYTNWQLVPTSILNTSGNANQLTGTQLPLTNICMTDLNNFIISQTITPYTYIPTIPGGTSVNTSGNTYVFNGYFPNLYNNITNYVLDISGSMNISGDINVKDGGNINTNTSTFHLLDTVVQTIYIGGAASSIMMGNSSNSVITANCNLSILGNTQSYGVVKSGFYDSIDSCGNLFVGALNLPGISNRKIKMGNFNNTVTTICTITLGGPQDQLILGGSGYIIISTPLKTTPIIYLNAVANSSSAGAGIHIADNAYGGLDAGYFVVSNDRAGYVLKAPASNNIVKFDVSGMMLPSEASPAQIMTLRPSFDIDSSYIIGVSSIDVSNVVVKNYLESSPTQQVIDTSLSILGTSVSMGKYTNLIPNAQLDVSGNVMATRLGIGTSNVNPSYALEINGNVFQNSGGFIWQF
jgi:hypothetical protein